MSTTRLGHPFAGLLPLLAYLLQVLYVFRLARRELGPLVGLLAGLACAILPLYHEFARMLFSEPVMVAASVANSRKTECYKESNAKPKFERFHSAKLPSSVNIGTIRQSQQLPKLRV